MRRFWIILLVVATAMVMALPAAAKGKPDKPPTLYEATIVTLDDEGNPINDEGIATACPGPTIQVTRTDTRGGAVTHFESGGARLDIQAVGLTFGDKLLEGCWGTEVWPEYFRITLDGDLDGDQLDSRVAMLWIFDAAAIKETIVDQGKSGKPRTEQIRTDFRMGGPYDDGGDFAAWGHVEEDGVITTSGTGTFNFVQFESGRDPMFLPLENGSQVFKLQITLTPLP